jgi:flagellar basal body-associated protein FliL
MFFITIIIITILIGSIIVTVTVAIVVAIMFMIMMMPYNNSPCPLPGNHTLSLASGFTATKNALTN